MRRLIPLLLVTACVEETVSLPPDPDPIDDSWAPDVARVCTTGENRCDAFVRVRPDGAFHAFAAPMGLTPADIQSAYAIGAPSGRPTIAIVDAYGYAALEADLGVYRSQFGLPACTRANGCLAIVNGNGQTSPLPAEPPPTDDWTLETALDVQMASAVCPTCRIVVVQTADTGQTMYAAQHTAVAMGATVISNSWGGPENTAKLALDANFDHPGIATFVSSGDHGYNEGGAGPHYPSVSSHVVSVGGTRLTRASGPRGWSEVAWSLSNGQGAGSSCSAMVPKPAYQANVPCAFKAATDLSAVADPATGPAVYNSKNGGWMVLGGTSAAAPIVASIFAVTGHGADASGPFIAQHTGALYDITTGTNGACGSSICNSGVGWDGPTGYGTPNATLLAINGEIPGLAVSSPADGAHVAAGFAISATAPNAIAVKLSIDGAVVGTVDQPPFQFTAPATLAAGNHTLAFVATAITGATKQVQITVTVDAAINPGGGDDDGVGGCTAGGGATIWLGLAIALAARRRRR